MACPTTYNYAAPGVRADGTPVVLKVCFPGKEVLTEVEALRVYDGGGAVRLLESDAARGLMLLERAVPGDPLVGVEREDEANLIAAAVMRALWKPVPARHTFPFVGDWGRGFGRLRERYGGGTGPFPRETTETAERLFAQLWASSAEPVVLHGDLHHLNILRGDEGRWLAIDPKGVVGEPAYEIGALVRNRLPDLSDVEAARRVLFRRIGLVAERTGLDAERMRRWAIAQAVLSAWWTVEDGGRFNHHCARMVALAEVLAGPATRDGSRSIRV